MSFSSLGVWKTDIANNSYVESRKMTQGIETQTETQQSTDLWTQQKWVGWQKEQHWSIHIPPCSKLWTAKWEITVKYKAQCSTLSNLDKAENGSKGEVGEFKEGGDQYILMTDWCCCMAESLTQHCKPILFLLFFSSLDILISFWDTPLANGFDDKTYVEWIGLSSKFPTMKSYFLVCGV